MDEEEPDFIKMYWQIEALKGQVEEMERDNNRSMNLIHVLRFFLVQALIGLGVQGEFGKMSDAEVGVIFAQTVKTDWRFSRCPNAIRYHCRPSSLQTLKTGELIHCEDCGWDIRDDPHILGFQENPAPSNGSNTAEQSRK
jgi:hypothetical protein